MKRRDADRPRLEAEIGAKAKTVRALQIKQDEARDSRFSLAVVSITRFFSPYF